MALKDPVKRKEYNRRYHAKLYASNVGYRQKKKDQNHAPERPIYQARYDAKRRGLPQRKAKDAIHAKVRKGELPAASTLFCSVCTAPASHYHHHFGYEQQHWYDVIPVCVSCHAKLK